MAKFFLIIGLSMMLSGCIHVLPWAIFSGVRTEVQIRDLQKKVEDLKQQKVIDDDDKKETVGHSQQN
jgi:hypothetical protein|tara:strand:+ start:1364 stop:1564 length:201 start_codon:yes stop_codon:yes gene_type:complete